MSKHDTKESLQKNIIYAILALIVISILITLIVYSITNDNIQGVSTIPAESSDIIYENTINEVSEEEINEIIAETIEEIPLPEEEEEEATEEELKAPPKVEAVVKYQDKEISIPKAPVAPVNSAEDAEKNKKTGGEVVKQEEAKEMFQNEGVHSNGIDVSAHQGKIDWKKVKASGVDFAIIRCGFRGQTEGKIYEDKYFKTNAANAAANGIKIGIYFYSTAINETESLEEAAWVVKHIAPYSITYPVVYDFEDFENYRCQEVDGAKATKNALAFLNYVKSNGYEPMMYANKNDITKRMARGSFSCKFWLAHYTTQTDYKGSFNMWQYTSKGSVPGISGNVDMNIAYFSYGTAAAPKHVHDFKEEVKSSKVEPTCTEKGKRTLRCSCGDTIEEEIPDKGGHKWGEWKVEKVATTIEEGKEIRKCEICDEEEERTIEKTKENSKAITSELSNTNTDTTDNTANATTNTTNANTINNSTQTNIISNNTVSNNVTNSSAVGSNTISNSTTNHETTNNIAPKSNESIETNITNSENIDS